MGKGHLLAVLTMGSLLGVALLVAGASASGRSVGSVGSVRGAIDVGTTRGATGGRSRGVIAAAAVALGVLAAAPGTAIVGAGANIAGSVAAAGTAVGLFLQSSLRGGLLVLLGGGRDLLLLFANTGCLLFGGTGLVDVLRAARSTVDIGEALITTVELAGGSFTSVLDLAAGLAALGLVLALLGLGALSDLNTSLALGTPHILGDLLGDLGEWPTNIVGCAALAGARVGIGPAQGAAAVPVALALLAKVGAGIPGNPIGSEHWSNGLDALVVPG